jgi:hypothetical protein
MNVSENLKLQQSCNLENIQSSVLYLLAAPSTPESGFAVFADGFCWGVNLQILASCFINCGSYRFFRRLPHTAIASGWYNLKLHPYKVVAIADPLRHNPNMLGL